MLLNRLGGGGDSKATGKGITFSGYNAQDFEAAIVSQLRSLSMAYPKKEILSRQRTFNIARNGATVWPDPNNKIYPATEEELQILNSKKEIIYTRTRTSNLSEVISINPSTAFKDKINWSDPNAQALGIEWSAISIPGYNYTMFRNPLICWKDKWYYFTTGMSFSTSDDFATWTSIERIPNTFASDTSVRHFWSTDEVLFLVVSDNITVNLIVITDPTLKTIDATIPLTIPDRPAFIPTAFKYLELNHVLYLIACVGSDNKSAYYWYSTDNGMTWITPPNQYGISNLSALPYWISAKFYKLPNNDKELLVYQPVKNASFQICKLFQKKNNNELDCINVTPSTNHESPEGSAIYLELSNSIVINNDALYIFAKGSVDGTWYSKFNQDTGRWDKFVSIPGDLSRHGLSAPTIENVSPNRIKVKLQNRSVVTDDMISWETDYSGEENMPYFHTYVSRVTLIENGKIPIVRADETYQSRSFDIFALQKMKNLSEQLYIRLTITTAIGVQPSSKLIPFRLMEYQTSAEWMKTNMPQPSSE